MSICELDFTPFESTCRDIQYFQRICINNIIFFNVDYLQANMKSYTVHVTHTLALDTIVKHLYIYFGNWVNRICIRHTTSLPSNSISSLTTHNQTL